jgi:hypothetical protein
MYYLNEMSIKSAKPLNNHYPEFIFTSLSIDVYILFVHGSSWTSGYGLNFNHLFLTTVSLNLKGIQVFNVRNDAASIQILL